MQSAGSIPNCRRRRGHCLLSGPIALHKRKAFGFLLMITSLTVRLLGFPPTKLKLKLIYDRQSVGQSWCQAPIWDPRTIFLPP
jgi:hypothetical protein